MQKKHMLVCEESLCPRKQPDICGPGLREAGRYSAHGQARVELLYGRGQGRACDTPAHGLIGLIGYSYQQVAIFFSGNRSPKNYEVKRAWPGAIWGWVTDREVILGCERVRTKCVEKTCVGL